MFLQLSIFGNVFRKDARVSGNIYTYIYYNININYFSYIIVCRNICYRKDVRYQMQQTFYKMSYLNGMSHFFDTYLCVMRSIPILRFP